MKNIICLLTLCILVLLSTSGCSRKALENFVDGLNAAINEPYYQQDTYYKHDAYGLGVHSDQYGRPVKWEVQGNPEADTSLLRVQQNTYGMGVHSDQYGRPVRLRPAW
jgi:hypothetical protein